MDDTKKAKIKKLEKEFREVGKTLSENQKRFADFMLADPNMEKKESYHKAYPNAKEKSCEGNATRVSKLPKVAAYIALRMELRTIETQIDADWVLRQAVKVHERCMQSSPVLDADGRQVYVKVPSGKMVPAYTFEHVGANKSLEIVGKHIDVQAFNEKSSSTHTIITDNGKDEW